MNCCSLPATVDASHKGNTGLAKLISPTSTLSQWCSYTNMWDLSRWLGTTVLEKYTKSFQSFPTFERKVDYRAFNKNVGAKNWKQIFNQFSVWTTSTIFQGCILSFTNALDLRNRLYVHKQWNRGKRTAVPLTLSN